MTQGRLTNYNANYILCLPFPDLQSADVDGTLHILQKLEDLLATGE